MRYCKLIPSKSNRFFVNNLTSLCRLNSAEAFSASLLCFKYMWNRRLLHYCTNLHFRLHNFVLKYIIVWTTNSETRTGGHTLNIGLENRLRSLQYQLWNPVFKSQPRAWLCTGVQESCTFEAVLPPSHLQCDLEKAQVMKMPAEGSQFGTGKVQRELCHNGNYSNVLLYPRVWTSAMMSSSFIPPLELMSFCRLKQWPSGTQPGAEPMLLAFHGKAHHHFSNSSCRSSCITGSNWCSARSRKAWSCKKAWVHAGYCQ